MAIFGTFEFFTVKLYRNLYSKSEKKNPKKSHVSYISVIEIPNPKYIGKIKKVLFWTPLMEAPMGVWISQSPTFILPNLPAPWFLSSCP